MKISELLNGVNVLEWKIDKDTEVKDIKIDSNQVSEGDLFVCLKGRKVDRHDFVDSLSRTAVGFITEKKVNAPYVMVENTREAYSVICQNFFGNPAKSMKLVSVVGTNGKTSTAHILSSLLRSAGINTGVIGTLGHFIGSEKIGESLTTPDPYEFNKLLQNMKARAVEVVVSEVSAHAIYYKKLFGIKADIAVLTNITQDHLDFFKDFDEYAKTKLGYFNSQNAALAVVNGDDELARSLVTDIPVITYGLEQPSDVFAIDVYPDFDGTQFVANLFDEVLPLHSPLYGIFNVYNLLAAMICAASLGVSHEAIKNGIRKLKPIDGRFNILKNGKGFIVIDYAHTPDGLYNVLNTARTITKSRLICVFGCGGDRDSSKRKTMGEVASSLCDEVVLTSDNPRNENPTDIISQIAEGVTCPLKTFVARTEAISYALNQMSEGDTVVIAGKGAETYMEIKGKKIPYSDLETVLRRGARG